MMHGAEFGFMSQPLECAASNARPTRASTVDPMLRGADDSTLKAVTEGREFRRGRRGSEKW